MLAKIYKPSRSAMTSGTAKTKEWVFEFSPEAPRKIDPLMGWIGNSDMKQQVRMEFESKDAAIAYAEAKGIPFQVIEPKKRKANIRMGGYGENFATNRRTTWTH
ncbi:MAG: ETC complex I subunit [Pseudomonadota bacterium]